MTVLFSGECSVLDGGHSMILIFPVTLRLISSCHLLVREPVLVNFSHDSDNTSYREKGFLWLIVPGLSPLWQGRYGDR